MEIEATLDNQVNKELKVHKVHSVLKEDRGLKDLLEIEEDRALQVLEALEDHKVILETKAWKDQLDLLVRQEVLEKLE